VWCLYPNKNAVLESVENVFGQEPDANNEVTSEKVYFIIILIIVFPIVDIQIMVVIMSVVESWVCECTLKQSTLF
jgi:hypothetical protein